MSLTAGSRIGPYEISARVAAGGMGEVLRARDTRIGRDVAIKVLPAEMARDADRLRRFEQEARAAGTLNHPNLVTIHEFGTHDGAPYLVMELLEGETLRDKLGDAAGPPRIPIRKAMEYGQQLATGLAAAHDRGIVHRDLKPDNIFITRDGRVKILDFGLAKVNGGSAADSADVDATQARKTTPGTIMGTVGYMSPEQVRGHDVDHRTDIFACGAILYEMISGRRAFRGDSSADTMSAILHEDPPELSASGSQISPVVDRVVRRCLEKEKGERFESARDLAFALDTVAGSSGSYDRFAAALDRPRRTRAVAIVAALLLAAAAVAFIAYRFGRSADARPQHSFRQLTFETGIAGEPTIAPDGKTFVFVKGESPHQQLFLQRVDGRSAIPLSKSADDDDHDPAFSPDGNQIAFRSERNGGGLFVMGATGESVRRLTSAGFNPSWSPDGHTIIFASEELVSPTGRSSISSLSTVDVATSAVKPFYSGDAMQPVYSPHQKRILYWALKPGRGGQRDIYTIAANGDPKSVVAATDDAPLDWNPVWEADGKSIIFASDRGGTMNLWRLGIDEETGKSRGVPQPLSVPASAAGNISLSRSGGQLLYTSVTTTNELRHGAFDPATQKVEVDPRPVLSGSMLVRTSEVSPDGQWIAFTTEERQEDLFVMKSDGTDLRQLTNDIDRDRGVSWWPDSSRVVFYSTRGGAYDTWSVRGDGSELIPLTKGLLTNFPIVSPDGRRVAFFDLSHARIFNVGQTPATTSEVLPALPGSGDGFLPLGWSPDGQRLVGTGWIRDGGIYIYSLTDHTFRPVTENVAGANRTNVRTASDRGDCRFIDDSHLLFWSLDGRIFVIDLVTGTRRAIGETPHTDMSRTGRYLLTLTRHEQSDIWQMTIGDVAASR